MNPLLALINETSTKQPVTFDENSEGEVTRIRKQVPAVVHSLSLQDLIVGPGRISAYDNIVANSLISQAGARITAIPGLEYKKSPEPGNKLMDYIQVHSRFLTIEAAPFSSIDVMPLNNPEQVKISGKPYLIANYDYESAPVYAVAFTLSRSDIRDLNNKIALNAVMSSIHMGLANIVDQVLLAQLEKTIPALEQPTSAALLKAAAARGLRFQELAAIAGGNLSGVEVAQDGTLRAYGIKAELTKFASSTIVGAFNRAAVSIEDDFRLTGYRKLNGSIEVVCIIQAQAQVPDSSAFWRV